MPQIKDLPALSTNSNLMNVIIPLEETVGASSVTKRANLGYILSQFGFTGSRGDTGFVGSVGYIGSSGAGFTGSQGAGFTGSMGSGYNGSRGYTGSIGSTGYTGSLGSTGYTGSVGSNGYTGSLGSTGYTGSVGSTGYTGSLGSTGYTGSVGSNGYTGSLGSTGYTGSGGTTPFTRGATWIASSGAITVPAPDVPIVIATTCTLQEVIILTQGGTGSCTVDIWKAPYASYPPTVANTIAGGTPPAISSDVTYQNNTLTGWTTSFAQNDVVMFHLSASNTFTQIAIQLRLQ